MNRHTLRLCGLMLGLLACEGGGQNKAGGEPSAHQDAGSDGPDAVDPATPDAGAAPRAIPLADWVEHLVDDYPESAQPDTVHDKVIEDTSDPDAFNAYLIER